MKRSILSFLFLLAITIYTYNGRVPITVMWDPSTTPKVTYQVQLIKTTGEIFTYGTSFTKIIITPPLIGQYHIRVRSVLSGSGHSAWCGSLMDNCAELKNGMRGRWEVKFNPLSSPK